jgi:hypothetical protein
MAWQLCTKQDVVNIHPVREEDLQDQWSDMVEALIRQYLGAPYLGTTQVITDEEHCGDGTTILQIRKAPIVSVSSLYVNGSYLTASDYAVFDTYIQLRNQVFPKGILNVKVSYTSGESEVSETVKLAAAAMVIAILNYNRRMGADGSLKWSASERQVGEQTPTKTVGLTSHLEQIMKRLLKRRRFRGA